MQNFVIATLQLPVVPELEQNFARAEHALAKAVRRGAALVVLPEMFACPYALEEFRPRAEALPGGPTSRFLSGAAARHGIHLVGGSLPELDGDDVYNTATLWGPDGALLATHRKVHLFDVDIPGGIRFTESESLAPGDRFAVAHTELGVIGLAICYDLRFPESFRSLALAGAELICLPGAFNTTTGPAHWEPLLRARAIENTLYVAACSPAAPLGDGYPAWGHSTIVDPYGAILATCEREEAILTAAVGGERLEEVRKALPVLAQRRPRAYHRPPAPHA